MIYPALYAAVVGSSMIATWVALYRRQGIPELATEPIRIRFHIFGELATAVALLASGIGVAVAPTEARAFYLVALGMLFYTVIVSPGYYAQRGEWRWLGLFAVVLTGGLVALALVV